MINNNIKIITKNYRKNNTEYLWTRYREKANTKADMKIIDAQEKKKKKQMKENKRKTKDMKIQNKIKVDEGK